MEQREERSGKKNRLIGMATSVGLHAALLLLFIFATGLRAPGPPAAEFGVIVNLGFDDQGSGDVQTDQPVSEPDAQQSNEQQPEETQPEIEPVKPTQEPVVEKSTDKTVEEDVVASKVESPVTVKKEEEKKKEEPKPKEPEKVKTEYTPDDAKKASQANNDGEKTESEGDDVNKTGNKGKPNGTLDPNAQYTGKPGGGGGGDGLGLSMGGWAWSEEPKIPAIPDTESGRIVFEIECDADGEIIGITTLEKGLSSKAEQLLKEEIRRNSLVRTSGGATPDRSKGRVVFVLKTR